MIAINTWREGASAPSFPLIHAPIDNRDIWSAAREMLGTDDIERQSRLLFESDDVSLYLFGWRDQIGATAHDGIGPHDHGRSDAYVAVLYGAMHHRIDDDRNIAPWHTISAGMHVYVPAGVRHDMQAGPAPYTVTLHAYTPRLTEVHYYDVTGKENSVWRA